MTQPWYIALRSLGPEDRESRRRYFEANGVPQIEDVIGLDMILRPSALGVIVDDPSPHVVKEKDYDHFHTDLGHLKSELDLDGIAGARILCVYRNPEAEPTPPAPFRLIGYDLVEAATATSAVSNCGGWPELDNAELTRNGLIATHVRALELQALLRRNHPLEPHAHCDVWAICVCD